MTSAPSASSSPPSVSLRTAPLSNRSAPPSRRSACSDWDAPGGKRLPLVLSEYRRITGSPIQSTFDLLQEFYDIVPETRIEGIRVTGSGSRTIAKILGIYFENEFKAIARMIGAFYPHVRTVFELGGESAKYIRAGAGARYRVGPASSITIAAASARPARVHSSISRRCAWATRSKKSAAS